MENNKEFDSNLLVEPRTKGIEERRNEVILKSLQTMKKCEIDITQKKSSKDKNCQQKPYNSTECEAQRCTTSFNISDLVSDKTIYIEDSESDDKISFNPVEITGRSTLHQNSDRSEKRPTSSQEFSVRHILNSSISAKVRNLCSTLPSDGDKRQKNVPADGRTSSTSTAYVDFEQSNGFLRTADLSSSKQSIYGYNPFDSTTDRVLSVPQNEDYAPGELMQSKMSLDRISWSNDYAAIPYDAIKESADKNAAGLSVTNNFDKFSITDSVTSSHGNFSYGSYFDKRCETISNIISCPSPRKIRTPVALVDDEDLESIVLTPRIDNKTYSKASAAKGAGKHESKDSGNASQISFWNLSAINKAISDLGLHDLNKNLQNAASVDTGKNGQSIMPDPYEINKENLPETQLSDTLSFSDSLMNKSNLQQLARNLNASSSRQPQGVLPTATATDLPLIIVSDDGNDADVDEYPTTPIKSPHRRVQRKKSPHPKSSEDAGLPTDKIYGNQKASRKESPQLRKFKSTELAANHVDCCEASSSCNGRGKSPQPVSPPRSLYNIQTSSPTSTSTGSPMFDKTTNSEGRLLTVGDGFYSNASSPINGETGVKDIASPQASSSLALVVRGAGAVSRSTSSCSTGSEYSHRDGKLMMKVTCLELSWGSTKLRNDVRKKMQVKNIFNKRLVVRISIEGPGFQLVNITSNVLTLQSQECTSIVINFCPTVTGVAIGALRFFAPHGAPSCNTPFLEIPLNGYGGHAAISPQNLFRDPLGAVFLPMGDLCDINQPFEQRFQIVNKGPLTGFFVANVDSIGLSFPRLIDAFEVHPSVAIIAPETRVTVRVVFRPKREDIKAFLKKKANVFSLATLRIICGDEANRQRMRRLVSGMPAVDRARVTTNSLSALWRVFPGELPVPGLETIKEKSNVTLDLLSLLRIHEITLTLNNENLDESTESVMDIYPDADDTVLFRTVIDDDTTVSSTCGSGWWVRPSMLEFNFNAQRRTTGVSLSICNTFKTQQYFEITCNHKNILTFNPCEGYIPADGGQIEVKVGTKLEKMPNESMNEEILILVYMANERVTVPVHIPKDNYENLCPVDN